MKKANKKISKFLKITLLLCMIFSQIASPIKTLADELIPSYNLEIEFVESELVPGDDKFIVTSDGTKVLEDKNYILEIINSFEYADGSIYETENDYTYALVNGNALTNGYDITTNHGINKITSLFNGKGYIYVNIYEIKDETDYSTYTEDMFRTLLTTENEQVEKIMETSFSEEISSNNTSIIFNVVGDPTNVVCDSTDGYKCNVTENDIDSLVKINYTTENGNFNPNKNYHTVLKVNGVVFDLVTDDLSVQTGEIVLDFSKLLPGIFEVEYSVRDDENNEIVSDYIEFTYVSSSEAEVDKIAVIKDAVDTDNINAEVFANYTLLTDEEKDSLGDDYRFLDTPVAFMFDNFVSFNQGTILTNYNIFDNGNRYHVISSSEFYGAFDDRSEAYKVSDVEEELYELLPFTTVNVVDSNGNEVSDNTYIQNGMKLVVTMLGEKLEYDFLVYSDVDGGYVEKSDLSSLIGKILSNNIIYYDFINLDINGDEVIDLKDISNFGVNLFYKDYTTSDFTTVDYITPVIESDKEELFVGESFEVVMSLTGFNEDFINAIEGFVNYDSESLRLDSVECLNELFVGSYLGNRFIYASDETFAENDEVFVKLTFTGLAEGVHKVSLVNMGFAADGVSLVANNSNELEITVNRIPHTDNSLKSLSSSVGYFDKAFDSETLEYNLYVDGSVGYVTLSGELNDEYATTDGFKTYTLYGGTTPISINVTAEDGTVRTYRVNVVKIYKSSNNNLSNLTVEGYEIKFDKDVLEYRIKVGADVTSLDISALVEDYRAWAKIEGNENFQEGENIVTITVYAEDGSTKTYKLIVDKEAEVPVEVAESSKINTEKIVIIILIVLVVAGLLYLIFKKEDDEDIKIEQVKPKKEETKKVEPKKEENTRNNSNNKKSKNKNKK